MTKLTGKGKVQKLLGYETSIVRSHGIKVLEVTAVENIPEPPD